MRAEVSDVVEPWIPRSQAKLYYLSGVKSATKKVMGKSLSAMFRHENHSFMHACQHCVLLYEGYMMAESSELNNGTKKPALKDYP